MDESLRSELEAIEMPPDDVGRRREFSISVRSLSTAAAGQQGPNLATTRQMNEICKCKKGCSSIFAAAAANSRECVGAFLNEPGTDVNQFSQDGATPLYCAVLAGAMDAMEYLLCVPGIDVDLGSKASGNSPLMRAAHQSNVAALNSLIQAGANISHISTFGFNALVCAVSNNEGALECVQALLSAGSPMDVQCHERRYSALHYAAHLKATAIVGALLDANADPSLCCKVGRCLAHVSARQGDAATLQAAVDTAARPEAAARVIATLASVDTSNMTPLHCALTFGHEEAALVLLGAAPVPKDNTYLQLAVSRQLVRCVQALLGDHGHNPNAMVKKNSILYAASVCCMPSVVSTLLENGASVGDAACGGNILRRLLTKLRVSRGEQPQEPSKDACEVISLLLNAGAACPDSDSAAAGASAVASALKVGFSDDIVRRLILDAGFAANEVDVQANQKQSALGLAISLGRAAIAEFLVAAGGLCDLPSDDELNPVLEAAKGGHAALLRSMGAHLGDMKEFASTDSGGNTLMHCAIMSGDHDTVQVALSSALAADLSEANEDEETPLSSAAAKEGLLPLLVAVAADEQLLLRNTSGESLLHIAASQGCESNCRSLLERIQAQRGTPSSLSAFVNSRVHPPGAPHIHGPTALHLGCMHGHHAVVQLLLQHGANPRLDDHAHVGASTASLARRSSTSRRPSRRSSLMRHLHKMDSGRSLLSSIADEAEAHQQLGRAPVLRRRSLVGDPQGDFTSVQSNLAPVQSSQVQASRAPPSFRSIFERPERQTVTPAREQRDVAIPFNCTVGGRTALHLACSEGHAQCAAAILHSVAFGSGNALRAPLGALCCAQDAEGNTPMHSAASAGHSDCVQIIAEKHPMAVCCINDNNETPLHTASAAESAACVSACISAIVTVRLHRANSAKRREAAMAAAAHDSDSDSSTSTMSSSSDYGGVGDELDPWAAAALQCESPVIVQLGACGFHSCIESAITKNICNVSDTDVWGNSALHAAVSGGHHTSVTVLIAHGADVNLQNAAGDTALHIAAEAEAKTSIRTILSANPSLHIRNAAGCRPCDLVSNPALQLQLTPLSRTLKWASLHEAELHWHLVTLPSTMGYNQQVSCHAQQFSDPAEFLTAVCRLQSSGGAASIVASFAARQYSARAPLKLTPQPLSRTESFGVGSFGRISVKVNGAHTACAVKLLVPREGRTLQDLVQETEYEVRVQQSLQNTEHIARVLGCVQVPQGCVGGAQSSAARAPSVPLSPTAAESTYDGNRVNLPAANVPLLPPSRSTAGSMGPTQQLASVSEYVPGCTWEWMVSELRDEAPASTKLQLARSLLTAVQQLHAQEVAHRDLHGGNVMVCVSAEGWWIVKLIDFGLAYPWSAGADDYMRIALGKVHASLRRPSVLNQTSSDSSDNNSLLKPPARRVSSSRQMPTQRTPHASEALQDSIDSHDFSCSPWIDVYGVAILLSWLYLSPAAAQAAQLWRPADGSAIHPSLVGHFMLQHVWSQPGALGGGQVEECVLRLLDEVQVQTHDLRARAERGEAVQQHMPNLAKITAEEQAAAGVLDATSVTSDVASSRDASESAAGELVLDSGYVQLAPPPDAPGTVSRSDSLPTVKPSMGFGGPRFNTQAQGASYAQEPDFGWGVHGGVLSVTESSAVRSTGSRRGAPPPPPQQRAEWDMRQVSAGAGSPPPAPPRAHLSHRRSTLRNVHVGGPSRWTRSTQMCLAEVSKILARTLPGQA